MQKFLEVHRQMFVDQRLKTVHLVQKAKRQYYEQKLSSGNIKETYDVIKDLSNSDVSPLPEGDAPVVAERFANFFVEKIDKIRRDIDGNTTDDAFHVCDERDYFTGTPLQTLSPVTCAEVHKVVTKLATKSCELDPAPTWLLKKGLKEIIPVVTTIVNESLASGVFPDNL